MKNYITKLLLVFFVGFTLLQSCSKNDTQKDNPAGGDAFRMQVITIDLPNTSLPNSEYHGSMGNSEITLTKGDEHELLFMVPLTMALGNQDLVINDLNNMKITYNVKEPVLPDTPDVIISPFLTNLDTFQATTSGNLSTQNAITSFNQFYSNASDLDKIKIASLYYVNKALFDDIILNDYSNVSGRSLLGAMQLLFKHQLAVIGMITGAFILIFEPEPFGKIVGGVLLVASAYKAKKFGDDFVQLNVISTNLGLGGVLGVNNKSVLSGLQLQNDVTQSVSFSTVDRTILDTDSTKDNSGSKLYFTFNTRYNDLVQQANPKIQWLNDNVPFCNFNLIPLEIVPTSSNSVNNPVDASTFSHLTLSITDPSLNLVSYSLASTGQLNIKVKINGTATSVNSTLLYTFSDEFSTFSGSFPITVTNETIETVTIGTQTWMLKNLDVTTYRNGDPIPPKSSTWANLTTGAYAAAPGTSPSVSGKLYNWYVLTDPRGIAPIGYHVPSDAEWTILTNYLGGNTLAGGAMKEINYWSSPNTGATNSSGFTGLAGGSITSDGFQGGVGGLGCWWSSSASSATEARSLVLKSNSGNVFNYNSPKTQGFSIRCIKD
jgi:uncharacterized protein (TIGR02145 family)